MTSHQRATFAYTAPFIAFVALIVIDRVTPLSAYILYPLRFVAVAVLLIVFSRPYLSLRPSHPVTSVLLGAAVFLIWIGPDALFGYRHWWLFENSITGKAQTSLSPQLRHSVPFLTMRVASSFVLVPILEELFWRGWLMRWLIRTDFLNVRFGEYAPLAFWIVAFLFASEHGPYWEVGLAAGILYNWWAVRTKNIADCILAHSVTNAILSTFVLLTGRWQYWL